MDSYVLQYIRMYETSSGIDYLPKFFLFPHTENYYFCHSRRPNLIEGKNIGVIVTPALQALYYNT